MGVDAGFDLAGRRAIVTGASAGIGAAIATRLAAAGAHVVAVSRSGSSPSGDGRIDGLAADLSEPAQLDRVIACFKRCRDDLGMVSRTMRDFAGP